MSSPPPFQRRPLYKDAPSEAAQDASTRRDNVDMSDLRKVYEECWQGFKVPDQTIDADGTTVPHVAVGSLPGLRMLLAEFCFSPYPRVAAMALRYLQRVLEASPIGHPHVASGLTALGKKFVDELKPAVFESLSLELSVSIVRCVFLILEAIRAEHLIGNLPALTAYTRESFCELSESLSTLNVRERDSVGGLLDETTDPILALWLEAVSESAKRLKSDVSTVYTALGVAADAAGAALKLYNGDLAAGFGQLRKAFKTTAKNLEAQWFETVAVLRQLCNQAAKDESIFRQLKWTVESGSEFRASVEESTPRFLLHVILCLDMIAQSGCADYIRESSLQMLMRFATTDHMHIQLVAVKVVEALIESSDPKVAATAKVLIVMLERAVLNKSAHPILSNYAQRLSRKWEANEDSVKVEANVSFKGYISVISVLLDRLEKDGGHEGGSTAMSSLMTMACDMRSRHAAKIHEALRRTVYTGKVSLESLSEVDGKTNMTPVHVASRSGMVVNLEWVLDTAKNSAPEQLAGIVNKKGPNQRQPIHFAGSLAVLELLLKHGADLKAKDGTNNMILHTTKSAAVCKYLVEHNADLKALNNNKRTPLQTAQTADVAAMLLDLRADLNATSPGTRKFTALHVASNLDSADVVLVLLERRANVEELDGYGRTALHFSTKQSLPLLLETKLCDLVNKADSDGDVPLQAVPNGTCAALLLKARADPNIKNNLGWSPILTALEKGRPDVIECLLSARADLLGAKNHLGAPPFWLACRLDEPSVALWMLESCDEATQMVLLSQVTQHRNPLCAALAPDGSTNVASVLAEFKADFEWRDPLTGCGAWDYAINVLQAKLLIEHGLEPTRVNPVTGESILFAPMAAEPSRLQDLLNKGLAAKINTPSKFGDWPLHYQIQQASARGFRLLVEKAADVKAAEMSQAPLSLVGTWACYDRSIDAGVIDLLLMYQCSPNATGVLGVPPLHYAIAHYHGYHGYLGSPDLKLKDAVDRLLEADADPRAVDLLGQTSLHAAVRCGHPELVERILQLCPGAVEAKDMAGETPLDHARRVGLPAIVAKLEEAAKRKAELRTPQHRDELHPQCQDPFLLAKLGRYEAAVAKLNEWPAATEPLQEEPGQWGSREPPTGWTVLHCAIFGGSLELVRHILQKAPALATATSQGREVEFSESRCSGASFRHQFWGSEGMTTPLSFLAHARVQPPSAFDMAKALVEARADPKEEGVCGSTVLFPAVYFGNHEVVRFLMEANHFQPDHLDKRKRRAMIHSFDGRTASVLLKAKASIEYVANSEEKASIIHVAALHWGSSLLETVLKHAGADAVSSKNERAGQTPITYVRNINALQTLLAARADVTATDSREATVLHRVCAEATVPDAVVSMIEMLVKAKCSVNARDALGRTPLSMVGRTPKVAAALIEAKAEVGQKDNNGGLAGAACTFSVDGLEAGLRAGLPLDYRSPDSGMDLPQLCLRAYCPDALLLLAEKRVDLLASINAKDKSSILHMAFKNKTCGLATTAYLLGLALGDEARATQLLTARDEAQNTLVHIAATTPNAGNWELQLLREELRKQLQDAPRSTWHLAVVLDTLRQADAMGALNLKKLINEENQDKQRPVDMVSDHYQAELLINVGADASRALATVNIRDIQMVDFLLSCRADVNAVSQSRTERTAPIHRVVESGDVHLAREWIIKRGADTSIIDVDGRSLIHYARQANMVSFLVEKKLDINHRSRTTGDTLLHEICRESDVGLIRHVFNELRAKPSKNFYGRSLMHVACSSGRLMVVEFLVKIGFGVEEQDAQGETPLHHACRGDFVALALFLLRTNANVHCENDLGETPMHEAVRSGNLHLVRTLLQRRADATRMSATKRTALHMAAKGNHISLVDLLLQIPGFPVDQPVVHSGATALHIAVKNNNAIMVQKMVRCEGIELDARNLKGVTPLALAASKDDVESMRVLCDQSSDLDLEGPLFMALSNSKFNATRVLVEDLRVQVTEHTQKDNGYNVLHILAYSGDDELASWLLQWIPVEKIRELLQGKDEKGETPIELAGNRDHERVILKFNAFMLGPTWQSETGGGRSYGSCGLF